MGFGKSLLFQLIPGLCVEQHNLSYSCYPKSPIVIVICPLNSLIECHMKELKHQGILCTCLPGNNADQDGRYSFKFALISQLKVGEDALDDGLPKKPLRECC